jgi:hypothetical protein
MKLLILIPLFVFSTYGSERPPTPPSDNEDQHELIYKQVIDLLDEIDALDEEKETIIKYDEMNSLDYIKTNKTPVPQRRRKLFPSSSDIRG